MEARASRLQREQKEQPQQTSQQQRQTLPDGTPIRSVQHTTDLSMFGMGPAKG